MAAMASEQEKNFEYFLKHYDDIFKQYGCCFVVLKNQKVIASYPSFSEAYHKTLETETLGDFSIQECNGEESGYTNYIASCEVVSA